MHYIEGGWPGSNPKDVEFFARARLELPSEAWAKVVAFGRCGRSLAQYSGREADKRYHAYFAVVADLFFMRGVFRIYFCV